MIKDDEKYCCLASSSRVGGPSTWHVTDWDQRRTISLTIDDEQDEQDDEDQAIECLSQHINNLPLDVYRIHVAKTGEILTQSTDVRGDQNHSVFYPHLHDCGFPDSVVTIRRDQLEELDRLGPDADLVTYPPCSKTVSKKVVFKYYFLYPYGPRLWNEMNLWMRLPPHPNIVPFDRVVLDELEGRVVGFTSDYLSGGSLIDNKSCIFQLKWLQQLMQVVDDLNLRYRISHQDIAPRNILIDESIGSIRIFDFNYAARIDASEYAEEEEYREDRNDVKSVVFTLYEIITRDESFRSVDHSQHSLDDLPTNWIKHTDVRLDHPATAYRQMLGEWRQRREHNQHHASETSEAINWTTRPKPPLRTTNMKGIDGRPLTRTNEVLFERRQDVVGREGKVLRWERPPQALLAEGDRLLCTGEFIKRSI